MISQSIWWFTQSPFRIRWSRWRRVLGMGEASWCDEALQFQLEEPCPFPGARGGGGDGRGAGADGILRAGGGGAGVAGQDIPVMEILWRYNGDIAEIDFNRVQVQSRFIWAHVFQDISWVKFVKAEDLYTHLSDLLSLTFADDFSAGRGRRRRGRFGAGYGGAGGYGSGAGGGLDDDAEWFDDGGRSAMVSVSLCLRNAPARMPVWRIFAEFQSTITYPWQTKKRFCYPEPETKDFSHVWFGLARWRRGSSWGSCRRGFGDWHASNQAKPERTAAFKVPDAGIRCDAVTSFLTLWYRFILTRHGKPTSPKPQNWLACHA